MIAKVRTRRLHQNGTVIRNSQKLRLRFGRVAMNQAVGKPRTRVSAVASTERMAVRTEDREMGVGPLPSVVEDVLLQEQVQPGVGGEHPLHAGIVAGGEERVDHHDQ